MLLLFLACKKVDPADATLDSLLHELWLHAEDGTASELAERMNQVDEKIGQGDQLEDPLEGTLSKLNEEEVAVVGVDVDPSIAAGLFLINPVACDFDRIERNMWWQKQEELYPDYEAYKRTYTSDIDAYLDRSSDTITWNTTYTANSFLTYDSTLSGSMRFIDAPESTLGPILLARAWITEPAIFEKDGPVFDADFQMEIWYTVGDHVLHVYPLWRHLDLGLGDSLNTNNENFQGTLLAELVKYDEDTEKLCEENIP